MGKHTGPLYFASLILCFGAEDMQDEDLTEQILSSRGPFFRWFCTNASLICISIPTFVHDLTFEGIPCAGMSLEFSV